MSRSRRRAGRTPGPPLTTADRVVIAAIVVALAGIMAIVNGGLINTGGSYDGGSGSSHKGGHYMNSATGNHYSKH